MDEHPTVKLTRHAASRAQQRGYRHEDMEMILQYGTPVNSGIVVLRKDAEAAIAQLNRERNLVRRLKGAELTERPSGHAGPVSPWSAEAETIKRWGRQEGPGKWVLGPREADGADRVLSRRIQRLARLTGTYVPITNGCVPSVYRPGPNKRRRVLRGHGNGRRRAQRREIPR